MIVFEDSQRFQYCMVGKFQGEPGWIHPDRVIDSYELLIGLEGTAFLCEGDQKVELKRNDVLLLHPGLRHYGYEMSTEAVSFYWMHFKTDQIPKFHSFHVSEGYDLQQMMKRLLHVSNSSEYEESVRDTLCYLIVKEAERLESEKKRESSVLVGEISEYIRLHRAEPITVESLSEKFGYHRDYLGKLYRGVMGKGLKEEIAAGRMAAAKELLLSTDLTVTEVSDKLSFPSPNTFVKFFSYHEGVSPLNFRNQYTRIHINTR